MRDEILTYWEMCAHERLSLQRGMHFRPPPAPSVVLMSRRTSAPYDDTLSDDGTELTYEGHDARREGDNDPKTLDQPWTLPSERPTENAMFAKAAEEPGQKALVRVYEKLRPGIWSDRGMFWLAGYDYVSVGVRKVFKFRMKLSDVSDKLVRPHSADGANRVIPSWVKQVVYKRDKGRCMLCGADEQIHFDHELPFSKGGSSLTPDNVRILCARHNLEKAAQIE